MSKTTVGSAARTAYAICAALLAIGAASAVLTGLHFEERATPKPSPMGVGDTYEAGFPEVDWSYWRGVNEDVVGWITVEGTSINHPIVQAPKDDPSFYLQHDVYRDYNPVGCPYLDSECYGRPLGSTNSVVLGHHWSGGLAFADFAKFTDEGYADEHSRILLQTPEWKRTLNAICVAEVDPQDSSKATSFSDATEFATWFEERYAESIVKIDIRPAIDNVYEKGLITFCTCTTDGLTGWGQDGRVLIYAA